MPNALYNQTEQLLSDPRVMAFLWVLRTCEGTTGANAYLTSFGFHQQSSCQVHPNIKYAGAGYNSEAFGKYQFMYPSYVTYRNKLQLPDFCEHSQDLAAAAYLNDLGAIRRLQSDDFAGAVYAVRTTWPSVYGGIPHQTTAPCSTLAKMQATYNAALGNAAPVDPGPTASTDTVIVPFVTQPQPNQSGNLIDNDTLSVIIIGALLWGLWSWMDG